MRLKTQPLSPFPCPQLTSNPGFPILCSESSGDTPQAGSEWHNALQPREPANTLRFGVLSPEDTRRPCVFLKPRELLLNGPLLNESTYASTL